MTEADVEAAKYVAQPTTIVALELRISADANTFEWARVTGAPLFLLATAALQLQQTIAYRIGLSKDIATIPDTGLLWKDMTRLVGEAKEKAP